VNPKAMKTERKDRADDAWPRAWMRRSGARAGLLIVGLGLAATSLVACGGSTSPGAAGAGGTTTTVPSSLELAHCMRAHGVQNFPDQSSSSGVHIPASLNANSPTFKAAEQACHKYWPSGSLSPTQTSQHNAGMLRFAQCMRAHGVTNFADPTAGPNGVDSFSPNPAIDTNSPTFQAARSACQVEQGPGGGGNGS
jgi:hypothetical protein